MPCLQAALQFCLLALCVMCSVARPFPSLFQGTLVVVVHARQHATLSCMNAPSMGQTLAAHVSVMAAVPRLWGVVSATACFEGGMVFPDLLPRPSLADASPLFGQL